MSNGGINGTDERARGPDAAVDAVAGAREEVIAGPRRRWSSAEKARIVGESLEPGAVARKVAERHGLTRFQLYDWRRKALAAAGNQAQSTKRNGSASATVDVVPAFAPVVMATTAIPQQPTASHLMEIAIGDVSVRVGGAVDVEGLVAVLNAIRRTS
jgi:transposase